jgi:phosphate transport system permease protein
MSTGRNRAEEAVFKALMRGSALLVLGLLLLIVGTILVKGLPALSLDMLVKTPQGGYYLGRQGGIANAIVGSLLLAGGATFLAIVLSLPVALYLNVYARPGSWLLTVTRVSLDILWGVPSIVYGAFGFALMLLIGIRASLLGGIIAVTLLIMPIMTRAMDEAMQMVPKGLLDASYCLGATRLETALRVVLRQSLRGLVSAGLIAFGRGVGDAASVIFTAGFSDRVPESLSDPAATLPLAIFFQLGTPFPEVQNRAYASALILTVVVLLVSMAARGWARRYSRHVIK